MASSSSRWGGSSGSGAAAAAAAAADSNVVSTAPPDDRAAWATCLMTAVLPRPAPTLLILRGISGSGKSSIARALSDRFPPGYVAVCNADAYFQRSGTYTFNVAELGAAHESCRRAFDAAVRRRTPLIILDNTNTTLREYAPYVESIDSFNDAVAVGRIGGVRWPARGESPPMPDGADVENEGWAGGVGGT